MALAIVQSASGSQPAGTGVPSNVVLGSTPTVGNLVIVFLHTTIGSGGATINTPAWQPIGSTLNADMNSGPAYILVRYVQSGDTTTLPVMATAGSGKWAYVAYEISGVAGNIESDLQVVGCTDYQGTINPLTWPSQTPQTANTLALASQSNVFDTSTVTVPSGWSADVNTGSQTNWGTLAGMHKGGSGAGTPISITANGYGGVDVQQVILQATAPTYPYVEQEYTASFNVSSGALNTPVLLQKVPKVGNLLIGIAVFPTSVADPTVASGWTEFARVSGGGNSSLVAMYRYAQGGDTASLAPFFTGTSSHFGWGYCSYELAGVTGTWGTDFQSVKTGQHTGSSFTTTADTTLGPNTLALVAAGISIGSNAAAPSVGSGWAFDGAAGSTFAVGSSQTYPSASSSVSNAVTLPASGTATWAQALFGPAPVNVNLTGVAAAGGKAAVVPSVSVTPGAAAASGAAAGVAAHDIAVVGTSGAAAAVTPSVSVHLGSASANGAVAGVQAGSSISSAAASGVAASVASSVSIVLKGAATKPGAAPIRFGPQVPFPLYRLIDPAPLPLIGLMDPGPLVLDGELTPSGPLSMSVEVLLQSVSATCHAATVTPSFDVRVFLQPAAAVCAAAPVIAA